MAGAFHQASAVLFPTSFWQGCVNNSRQGIGLRRDFLLRVFGLVASLWFQDLVAQEV